MGDTYSVEEDANATVEGLVCERDGSGRSPPRMRDLASYALVIGRYPSIVLLVDGSYRSLSVSTGRFEAYGELRLSPLSLPAIICLSIRI